MTSQPVPDEEVAYAPHSRRWLWQVPVLISLVVLALLAYRQETLVHDLKVTNYNSCLARNKIIDQFNSQQRMLAEIEQSQTLDTNLGRRRINAYLGGISPVFKCGSKP